MKRRTEIKTKTYEADYGFMVDIVDDIDRRCGEALWSVYLYRENFGVKMHMFGLMKSNTPTIKEVVKIVENNLPDYYGDYDEQYAQYDNVDRSYEDDFDFDEDCDCDNCPHRDEDCEECEECCGIETVIPFVETEENIKQAAELKIKFADFLRTHMVTEEKEKLEAFITYSMNNFGTGWWIGINDAGLLFDMFHIAQIVNNWLHTEWYR